MKSETRQVRELKQQLWTARETIRQLRELLTAQTRDVGKPPQKQSGDGAEA